MMVAALANDSSSPAPRTQRRRWWYLALIGVLTLAMATWLIRLTIIHFTVMQLTGNWNVFDDDSFTKWRVAAAGRIVMRRHTFTVSLSRGLDEEEFVNKGMLELCNRRIREWNGLNLSVEVSGDEEVKNYVTSHLQSHHVWHTEKLNANGQADRQFKE